MFNSSMLSNNSLQIEQAIWNTEYKFELGKPLMCQLVEDETINYEQWNQGLQQGDVKLKISTDWNYAYQIQDYIYFRETWWVITNMTHKTMQQNYLNYKYNSEANKVTILDLEIIHMSDEFNPI